jgi:hypothetical protein
MLRFLARGLLAVLLLAAPAAVADDISNGSWSTTDGSNTAAPPNGWPAGMFPNQVEPSARSNMGGVKRWWERANAALSTTGSAGAYVITPSNTSYPTAYTQGEIYCAKANFTSVGNDTLNVNSLGAKPLYSSATGTIAKIAAGDILSASQFCASYDSALNSAAGGFQILSKIAGGAQSIGTSGYTTLPGGLIIEWVPYSITAAQTTNTPAGTVWGQQSVSYPIACPSGGVFSFSFGSTTTANGQFASVSATTSGSSAIVFATTYGGATQPLTGTMTIICH